MQDGSNTGVNEGELRQFVQRLETVQDEIDSLNEQKSEIYKEVKALGYDAPALRQIIKIRRGDQDKRQHMLAVLELYAAATGTVL